jgi:hypothetical protein
LFGWLARHYQGAALAVESAVTAAAAQEPNGMTAVFVSSGRDGLQEVRVPLDPLGAHRIASAQVLYVRDPDSGGAASINPDVAALPVTVLTPADRAVAAFTLNPGGPGRGAGWEIALIEVSP